MVAGLDDRFSHYLTPSELEEFDLPPHFAGIGVEVGSMHRGLAIARVFNESPAARAGLQSGQVIVAVNGRPLQGLSRDQAVALIKGNPGTDVVLEIEGPASAHAGKPPVHSVRITRAIVSEPVVASATATIHGKKLGVVALASFTPGAHVEVMEAVQQVLQEGARGIVLDLRDNGGGLVEEAQLIASIFIPHGVIVSTSGRTQPRQVLMATGGAISTAIPMVVLVNENTASAAEIVTAALQDHHRATIVGSHTFGKGVFQEEQKLANGGALDITVGEYFTPNGRNLGGGGVKTGSRSETRSARQERPRRAPGAERGARNAGSQSRVSPRPRDGAGGSARGPAAVPARTSRCSSGAAGSSPRSGCSRTGARSHPGAARSLRPSRRRQRPRRRGSPGGRHRPRSGPRAEGLGTAGRAPDRPSRSGPRRDRGADARPWPTPGIRRGPRRRTHGRRHGRPAVRPASAATCARSPTFTVDPAGARDFDDAISAEALADGARQDQGPHRRRLRPRRRGRPARPGGATEGHERIRPRHR